MIKIIDRIILIGTSHIAENSVKEIEEAIERYSPEVVALELDTHRFKNLMNEDKEKDKGKKKSSYKSISELGAFGYMFAQVAGFVQKKVGAKVDMEPGIDMKSAYLKARENKVPVALIDIDIRKTLKKLSNLSFFKKVGLAGSIFFKSFKKEYRDVLDFDLKSVPDDEVVVKMIKILEKETPELHRILIDDRNHYMVSRLLKLRENHNGNIIAIVGAGHVDGMGKLLERRLSIKNIPTGFSYSYYVDYNPENNV